MKMLKETLFIGILIIVLTSCEGYLDIKPSQSLAIPNTLLDLQAMMDFETNLNASYPDAGDIASEYYYLLDNDWAGRDQRVRDIYLWEPNAEWNQWSQNYSRINYTNIVLDGINTAEIGSMTEIDRGRIRGAAQFFRGFTFLHLVNIYAPPYEKGKNQGKLGIPLRLEADINIETTRATLEESYQQIVNDFKSAAYLLPNSTSFLTRPSKPAAFAALARIFLIMGDYKQAAAYADSCLALKSHLIDYNDLNLKAAFPFDKFNLENLFYAEIVGSSGVFAQSRAKVNPAIYQLYNENDLRKQLFFVENKDGSHAFKGSYAGKAPTSAFAGLAVDEVYLIRAECAVRSGDIDQALYDLNTLLVKRYVRGKFAPIQIRDQEKLLRSILEERKMELVFRGGIHWSDLRRLNLDEKLKTELSRIVNEKEYRLPANDLRYTFIIPSEVIQKTNIEQNLR